MKKLVFWIDDDPKNNRAITKNLFNKANVIQVLSTDIM